jgi:23S rRNA (adenine1618-N6)-methyltransferase
MIRQSRQFKNSCFCFSTLISKQSNLESVYEALEKAEVTEIATLQMGQGNKTSRIVVWSFLTKEQQKEWKNTRWNEPK